MRNWAFTRRSILMDRLESRVLLSVTPNFDNISIAYGPATVSIQGNFDTHGAADPGNELFHFTLGSQSENNSIVSASFSTIGMTAGSLPLTISFAGNSTFEPATYSASVAFPSGNYNVLHNFEDNIGTLAFSDLTIDPQGDVFGSTVGAIWEIPAGSSSPTLIYSFTGGDDGEAPNALVTDSQGNLFGVTEYSHGYFGGALFEISADTHQLSVLRTGFYVDGPTTGTLLLDNQGNLYGFGGDKSTDASVFKFNIASRALTTYAGGVTNVRLDGSMALDGHGNLFAGGSSYGGQGVIVKLNLATGEYSDFYNNNSGDFIDLVSDASGNVFAASKFGSDGIVEIPAGADHASVLTSAGAGTIAVDSAGNVFGMLLISGDRQDIFELPSGAASVTMLYSTYFPDSFPEVGTLVLDPAGNLLGSIGDGVHTGGSLFKFDPVANSFSTLYTFGNAVTAFPNGTLVADPQGNLFGTRAGGGPSNSGQIFKLAPGAATPTTLYSFTGAADGAHPSGVLATDSSGNLFGMSESGGQFGFGTVFEIPAGSDQLITLASFDSAQFNAEEELASAGGLIADSHGNLFGTTPLGSTWGTIFEISNGNFSVIRTFSGSGSDFEPNGQLAFAPNGDLIGATKEGEVFALTPGSNNFRIIAQMTDLGPSGGNILGGVATDSSGNIFFRTDGAILEVPAGSTSITPITGGPPLSYLLHDSGAGNNGLTIDSHGNLWGTIQGTIALADPGQANTFGYIFELPADKQKLLFVHTFQGGIDGAYPPAGLTFDSSGHLFGVTESNPESNLDGGIFEFTPASIANFDHPVVVQQPTTGAQGGTLSPIVVNLVDSNGNLATGDNSPVRLAFASGPLVSTSDLSGTLEVRAVNGVATFNDLSMPNPGAYPLAVVDETDGLSAVLQSINVSSAQHLVFTVPPASVDPHVTLPVVVTIFNADGSIDTAYNSPISVSLLKDSFSIDSFLEGTKSVVPQNGVATFPDLSVDLTGTFQLSASGPGVDPITSAAFTIGSDSTPPQGGGGAGLVFLQQPSSALAGAKLHPIQVQINDANGNLATKDRSKVTLTIASGPSGGKILGTAKVTAKSGIATFKNISFRVAGDYVLTASDDSVGTSTSVGFTVSPAAVSKILFTRQPANVTHGVPFAVQVQAQDKFGNPTTAEDSTVILSLGSHPKGALLGGEFSVTPVDATASFDDLILDTPGKYSLTATLARKKAKSVKFIVQ